MIEGSPYVIAKEKPTLAGTSLPPLPRYEQEYSDLLQELLVLRDLSFAFNNGTIGDGQENSSTTSERWEWRRSRQPGGFTESDNTHKVTALNLSSREAVSIVREAIVAVSIVKILPSRVDQCREEMQAAPWMQRV